MPISKLDLAKFGKTMQKSFGHTWPTGVTRRPNWWEKLAGAVGTLGEVVTPWRPSKFWEKHKVTFKAAYGPMGVTAEKVMSIEERTDEILASHIDYSPQQLADELKKLNYDIEEIRRVSPYLEGVE